MVCTLFIPYGHAWCVHFLYPYRYSVSEEVVSEEVVSEGRIVEDSASDPVCKLRTQDYFTSYTLQFINATYTHYTTTSTTF